MKKIVSVMLLAALLLSLFTATASAADSNPLSKYSDKELRELYEAVREEMIARGLPLAQEVTLREGKFIVGEDILPGTYTLKCLSTSGDTYGDMYSALGGMEAIREHGLSIPEDISIAGFDGVPLLQLCHPRLTTVSQNTRMIGEAAATKLIELIEKPSTTYPEILSVPCSLVEGETIAPLFCSSF